MSRNRWLSPTPAAPGRPDVAALLVRPDGYVAWAAGPHESPARTRNGLADALRRWFGAPVRAAATMARPERVEYRYAA